MEKIKVKGFLKMVFHKPKISGEEAYDIAKKLASMDKVDAKKYCFELSKEDKLNDLIWYAWKNPIILDILNEKGELQQ